jgi:hypothetical protein
VTLGPWSPDPDELCFRCHAYDVYGNDVASATVQSASRFNKPNTSGGHALHVGELGVSCYACHDSHGSTSLPHLMVTGRSPGLLAYSSFPTGGSCTTSCHMPSTYAINYPR